MSDIAALKLRINNVIDDWAAEQGPVAPPVVEPEEPEEERVLPEGKRVVRTKSMGDRVYLLDEEKKTRAWVTNATILDQLGFRMEDVAEVEDSELLGYQMTAAIYRVNDESA